MKKAVLVAVAALLCAVVVGASASNFYLIPDSNTRELPEYELRKWSYDGLGYCLNELFARHGYSFDHSEPYYAYFSCQGWYSERSGVSKEAILAEFSAVERANADRITGVRRRMKENGEMNEGGKKPPAVSR